MDMIHTGKRNIGRRNDDIAFRKRTQRFKKLYNIGQTITSEIKMDALFCLVIDQTNQVMNTERSTLFLYDDYTEELWSLVATGMTKNEIRIKKNSGLAGWVFQNKKQLIDNDTYKDSRFNLDVDRRTGYRTKNILCVPVFNRAEKCIGTLEALNRRIGSFEDEDAEFLKSISNYIAIAVENSRLYEDIKAYTERLEATIFLADKLEKIKAQLTKFVPASVAKIMEQEPDKIMGKKILMDVSVLFIDIQGFSGLMENFDQRLVNDMVEKHFSKYLLCVGRHGGELNETSGDGLMIMFKSDTLKHHAQGAVAAGMAIVKENQRLNKDLSYPWDDVHLHMGINSGKAYVGTTRMMSVTGERLTYTASGLVTVIAARIGELSENTSLFIGPETYSMIRDIYPCDFIGDCRLKNISERISIFRVKSNP
jgi:class 3 adenylate cyclase/putative methionine-R-sulfoxide reductase with GAF domain